MARQIMTRHRLLALPPCVPRHDCVRPTSSARFEAAARPAKIVPFRRHGDCSKAKSSDWAKKRTTDDTGEFKFNAVPLGRLFYDIASQGFRRNFTGRHRHIGNCAGRGTFCECATANDKSVSGAPEVAPNRFRHGHDSRQPHRYGALRAPTAPKSWR